MSATTTDLTPQRSASRRAADRRRRLVRGGIVAAILVYLAVLLLAPLTAIALTVAKAGFATIWATLSEPRAVHALEITAIITVITVAICSVFGVIVAWVLTRQRFAGRSIVNAIVDLPFAIAPVTVGLMAVLLFGRTGWFYDFFNGRDIDMIYALPSMVVVTIFIAIPFVIREVAPVLEEMGTEEEDAARTLGASSWKSFRTVTLPNIRWGLLYGIGLTVARSIGEIGAVYIVSGAIIGKTETLTIYVLNAYEERLVTPGNIVAMTLATISILLLVTIEFFKRRSEKERKRS